MRKNVVSPKVICCAIVLCGIATTAHAQETKTFSEAECSYTLPEKEWIWADPKKVGDGKADVLVFAGTKSGFGFYCSFKPVLLGQRTDAKGLESFEGALIQELKCKKLGGRHFAFRGIPCYQVDVQVEGAQKSSLRIMCANHKFYQLYATNAYGKLEPEEAEKIFEGFRFLGKPESPDEHVLTPTELAYEQGKASAPLINCCCGMFCGAIVVSAIGLVVFLVMRNNNRNNRPYDSDPYPRRTQRRRRSRRDEDASNEEDERDE
jgi:hypothetical protein